MNQNRQNRAPQNPHQSDPPDLRDPQDQKSTEPARPGRTLFKRFLITAIPSVILLIIVSLLGLGTILRDYVIGEARRDTARLAAAFADEQVKKQMLEAAVRDSPLKIKPPILPAFSDKIRQFISAFGITRLRIYDFEGDLIYSTDPNDAITVIEPNEPDTIIVPRPSGTRRPKAESDPNANQSGPNPTPEQQAQPGNESNETAEEPNRPARPFARAVRDNPELQAALAGQTAAKFHRAPAVIGANTVTIDLVDTYVPLPTKGNLVVGVFMTRTDVTDKIAAADATTIKAEIILVLTVLGIFGVLTVMVRRTAVIIDRGVHKLKIGERKYMKLSAEHEATIKELRRSNRELKDFAHIVAHDLKAPLRGIGTLAEWLDADYSDRLGESAREKIDLLKRRAVRMSRLIDSILRYSEIGRTDQPVRRVDTGKLLHQVTDDLDVPANVTIEIDENMPTIVCERTRIAQVFYNLIGNAAKYIDKPKGLIRVWASDEGDFWKFAVADNGPGIAEEHHERIFKIFQTLDPGENSKSTGVGLAMVKKIVETYGGSVWVESEPGKGSTFFFTLPRSEVAIQDVQL